MQARDIAAIRTLNVNHWTKRGDSFDGVDECLPSLGNAEIGPAKMQGLCLCGSQESVKRSKEFPVKSLAFQRISLGELRMDFSNQNGRVGWITPCVENFLVCAKVERGPFAR